MLIFLFYPIEYSKNYSPDKQYVLIGKHFLYQSLIPTFPGQGGDKSGFVYVYDLKEKRIIGIARIPMLSMMHEVSWKQNSVKLKLINTWNLPRSLSQ